jgi:hypothetical protein
MNKRWLVFAIVMAFVIIVTGVVLYVFRSNPDSVKKFKPDFTLTAREITSAFEEDENNANKLYLVKVILVKGIVKEVTTSDGENIIIYLDGTLTGGVSCLFKLDEISGMEIKPGDTLSIKGKCTGFILDVVLTKCCLVKG